MRCISILRYLAEYADNLPICVLSRLLATHDVPYLLVQLIENHPWQKENTEGKPFHIRVSGKMQEELKLLLQLFR